MSQQDKRCSMFKPDQTKILQRWFLDNIEHPYIRKTDKNMLANKTGLSTKQITGWFTNNRKRKYQKAVQIAKKRGKSMSYVKDIMIMKFKQDLEQSNSSIESLDVFKQVRNSSLDSVNRSQGQMEASIK